MTHLPRVTVFECPEARVEVFRSEEDGRVEAIVVYAASDVGVLRMPECLGEPGAEDTLPFAEEPTSPPS
jgi:hypothetical protein